MVKILDDYRIQYEKETGKAVCAEVIDESLIPKWEYVCWLEEKLWKYEHSKIGAEEHK